MIVLCRLLDALHLRAFDIQGIFLELEEEYGIEWLSPYLHGIPRYERFRESDDVRTVRGSLLNERDYFCHATLQIQPHRFSLNSSNSIAQRTGWRQQRNERLVGLPTSFC